MGEYRAITYRCPMAHNPSTRGISVEPCHAFVPAATNRIAANPSRAIPVAENERMVNTPTWSVKKNRDVSNKKGKFFPMGRNSRIVFILKYEYSWMR
jgi:hypothetical protein